MEPNTVKPEPIVSSPAQPEGGRLSRSLRPWLAGLLSLVLPGLGQLYAGKPWRGLFWVLSLGISTIAADLILLNLELRPVNVVLPVLVGLGVPVWAAVDAIRVAGQSRARPVRNLWYVYLAILAIWVFILAPAFLASLHKNLVRTYSVPTAGMEKTILFGDHVVVSTGAYSRETPVRWDIIAYREGDSPTGYIKRVVGLPGETVEIRGKVLLINGKVFPDPHATHTDSETYSIPRTSINYSELMDRRDNLPPFRVPAGSYFLLGDNRDNSLDSRFKGPIRVEQLLGKVRRIYWSRNPQTKEIHWSRIGVTVK